jgi:hypothetical protein
MQDARYYYHYQKRGARNEPTILGLYVQGILLTTRVNSTSRLLCELSMLQAFLQAAGSVSYCDNTPVWGVLLTGAFLLRVLRVLGALFNNIWQLHVAGYV